MKNITLISAVVFVCAACGQKEEKRDLVAGLSSSSLLDSAVQGEMANALASEALSAAAAGESSSTASSLALNAGTDADHSVITRKCEAQADGSALVTISSTIDRSFVKENGARTLTVSMTGKGSQTRLWSKEGETLECKNNHFYTQAGFQAGLKLHIELEREREMKRSFVNARGKENTMAKSFSLKAERDVEWLAVNDSAQELVRQKKISNSEATRSMKIENSKGKNLETSLKVTIGDAGLVVTVKRDLTTKSLTSKLIESGEVVATLKDGAEVTTSYSNLLFSVNDGKCTMVSGSFTMTIKDKDGAAGATVTCTGSGEISTEGKLQCTSSSGGTIEIDQPLCDPEDAA